MEKQNPTSETEYWRGEMKRIFRDFFLFFVAVVAILLAAGTWAWFASNKEVDSNNMMVMAQEDGFELAIPEAVTVSAPKKAYLTRLGTVSADQTSFSNPGIYMTLENENGKLETTALRPGAYGELTFYVISPEDIAVDFTMFLHAVEEDEEGNLTEIETGSAREYLKGHILFFQTYVGGKYADRIDGSFTYRTEEHPAVVFDEKGRTGYPVTIYWVWPKTFGQMVLLDGNRKLTQPALFDEEECAGMTEYICEHPEYFFDGLNNSFAQSLMMDVAKLPPELSNGYNDADQAIGEEIQAVAVELTATQAAD